jgi:tetratricopeptide (TPR) repeat protein
MKKFIKLLILIILISACSSKGNDDAFISTYSGRYLYNSDEVLEVYFKNAELFLKWRGAETIKPLKVAENTFFVKEMNEKIEFVTDNSGNHSISLVPKEKNDTITLFKKLKDGEKIPIEYIESNEFDKALEAYLKIKETDSLDTAIDENDLNSRGYKYLRSNNYKASINIFKVNAALYPESANVYDSLAEAYMKSGDTIQAISNYEKSLKLDSGNQRAKRMINKLTSSKK